MRIFVFSVIGLRLPLEILPPHWKYARHADLWRYCGVVPLSTVKNFSLLTNPSLAEMDHNEHHEVEKYELLNRIGQKLANLPP